tara:strand:+ start:1925 stop:2284 length:360 start_codon:yes stop_codon:yes gene_type:complete
LQNTRSIGNKGELIALNYFKSLGYTLLQKNWRVLKMEIDMILSFQENIVFVEVKYRENRHYKMAELLSISQEKRLVEAMDIYIRDNEIDCEPRFDLIFVSNQYGINKIYHFPSYIQPTL